jgi:hypothetical protein
VIDEFVAVQDPSIETTEVTVSSEVDSKNTETASLQSNIPIDYPEFISKNKTEKVPCDIIFEDIHEKSPTLDMKINSTKDLVFTNKEQFSKRLNVVEMMMNSEKEREEERDQKGLNSSLGRRSNPG